jgi:hypothetical protein
VRQTRLDLATTASQALTIGADYTFALGNGLHVLAEAFVQEFPPAILGQRVSQRFAASTVSYPLGIIDSLSGIVTVDTERGDVYRFLNWQRTFDRWQFYFMGFWNPRQVSVAPLTESNAGRNPLSGKGIEILAVFNHGTSKAPSTARQP